VSRFARLLALAAALALAASPFAARGHTLALALAGADVCSVAGSNAPALPGDAHADHCECCTSAHAPPPALRVHVVPTLAEAGVVASATAVATVCSPAPFLARAPPAGPVLPT
jgi:hypothetical protein